MGFIRAIVKRPEELYGHVCNVSNRLGALQTNVGGYIETVTLDHQVVIICDEEGRLKGYDPNCVIKGYAFYGTIIAVGIDHERSCFADLPISMKEWKENYLELKEVKK